MSEPAAKRAPHVKVYPSPDGVVTLVGVDENDAWLCEWRCRVEDFDADTVQQLEMYVRQRQPRRGLMLV